MNIQYVVRNQEIEQVTQTQDLGGDIGMSFVDDIDNQNDMTYGGLDAREEHKDFRTYELQNFLRTTTKSTLSQNVFIISKFITSEDIDEDIVTRAQFS